MPRLVAFLRAINSGSHRRARNVQLCAGALAAGFVDATGFLASGNLILGGGASSLDEATERLEAALEEMLAYEVPVFLRREAEVLEMAAYDPFPGARTVGTSGLQVAMLSRRPEARARRAVHALPCGDDRLVVRGRELYWLPFRGIPDSPLSPVTFERILGPITIRTRRTVKRLADRLMRE